MSSPVRNRISVLVTLGLGLLTVVGAAAFVFLQSAPETADLLPADTVAYWKGVHREELNNFVSGFPVLTGVPASAEPFDLALIRHQGALQWALFPSENDSMVSGQRTEMVEGKKVLVSSASLLPLLAQEHATLAGQTFYRQLTGNTPTFALISVADWPTNAGIASGWIKNLTHSFLLRDASHIVLANVNGIVTLRTFAEGRPVLAGGPTPTIMRFSPAPDVQIAAANGKSLIDIYETAQSVLPTADAAALRTDIEALLGTDISPRYDVLPLLDGPATLALRFPRSTGATLSYSIDGESHGPIQRTLKRLHASIESVLSAGVVVQTTFDAETTIRQVRQDPEGILRNEHTDGGWTTQSTQLQSDKESGIVSSYNGRRYTVTNNPVWAAAEPNGTTVLPRGQGQWIAGGTFSLPPERAPAVLIDALLVAPQSFVWSLEQEGFVRSLLLQGMDR